MNTLSLILTLLLITGTEPESERVRNRVLDMATEALSVQYPQESYRFELNARWIPNSLLQSDEEDVIRVRQVSPLSSYTLFEVTYRNHGQLTSAEIQLKVDMEQRVPVTATRLERGTVLSTDDLTMRWVEVAPGREHPISGMTDISGSVLRRTLLAFEPLLEEYVSEPLYVEAGQEVTMEYETAGIRISVVCEARQNGSLNEEITVFCKETRRKYLALVTGQGEALWLKTQ